MTHSGNSHKKIQLTGKILSEVEHLQSKTGQKPFIKFSILDDRTRKIYWVLGFKAMAWLTLQDLPVGHHVSITGSLGDDSSVFAQAMTMLGDGTKTAAPKQLISREQRQQLEQAYASSGFVRVTDRLGERWLHKDDCILVGTQWHAKIEYLMDKLGPERVSQEIRTALKDVGIPSRALSNPQVQAYRELRERLLDEAMLS